MNIRFMTYNIQHGMDHARYLKDRVHVIDLGLTAKVISRYKPDIVGLNEVRDRGAHAEYREQTREMADRLGYEHCYFAKAVDMGDGPYGNAILSRFPMRSAVTVPIPDPMFRPEKRGFETRCILKAEFEAPARFDVLISHFGLNPAEQRNAVATLLELTETRQAPVVFMGDLNMEPDDPTLAPVFRALHDAAALLPPDTKSFPSEKPQIKIDYIFASDEFRAAAAEIPQAVASDHCPHIADLSL